jgi:hypothetical protein
VKGLVRFLVFFDGLREFVSIGVIDFREFLVQFVDRALVGGQQTADLLMVMVMFGHRTSYVS